MNFVIIVLGIYGYFYFTLNACSKLIFIPSGYGLFHLCNILRDWCSVMGRDYLWWVFCFFFQLLIALYYQTCSHFCFYLVMISFFTTNRNKIYSLFRGIMNCIFILCILEIVVLRINICLYIHIYIYIFN